MRKQYRVCCPAILPKTKPQIININNTRIIDLQSVLTVHSPHTTAHTNTNISTDYRYVRNLVFASLSRSFTVHLTAIEINLHDSNGDDVLILNDSCDQNQIVPPYAQRTQCDAMPQQWEKRVSHTQRKIDPTSVITQ